MKIRIRILVVLAAFLALAAFRQPAAAQSFDMNVTDDIKEYIGQVIPPYIGTVTMDPEEPAADEDVTVTASVAMIPVLEEDIADVSEVVLYYSTDGGESWEEESMDQGDNEELWTAVIPGQEAGTTVDFYIKAVNDVGSISFEMMDKEIDLDVGVSQVLSLPGSGDLTDADVEDPFENLALIAQDEESDINPVSDLREVRFGYDADNLYFRLKFDKKIDGGRFSPLQARVYLGVLLDVSMDGVEFDASQMSMRDFADQMKKLFPTDDLQRMAKEGADRLAIWFWAPIAEGIPPLPGVGKIPKEALIKLNPDNIKAPIFNTTGFDSDVQNDGTVDISIERESFGKDMTQLMFLFGVIEASGDLANIAVSFPDMSFPTILKMTPHKYTVE